MYWTYDWELDNVLENYNDQERDWPRLLARLPELKKKIIRETKDPNNWSHWIYYYFGLDQYDGYTE